LNKEPVKTAIVIAGPTAVGKTKVAIDIARHFNTEIISADSRQCYREMNIGVARPSFDQLQAVPHHFIATHSIREEVTAITFEKYALNKCQELFQRHNTVVMTGGTGLYIKAFSEGLDEIPGVPAQIRGAIIKKYEEKGIGWLQDELQKRDPVFYSTGEINNPQRMMRALEVLEATGQSIVHFRKGQKATRNFNIKKIGLELPRQTLRERVDARVDMMIVNGLLQEVNQLFSFRHLNALQTVGYAELFNHLEGKVTLVDAIEEIKIHTRQYAKRQMTWFKKDKTFVWCSPDTSTVLGLIEEK
jgi:tRNA dimethylallyltransferase